MPPAAKHLMRFQKNYFTSGSSFQFVRTGYFVRDTASDGVVYNRIVGLKDGYKAGK